MTDRSRRPSSAMPSVRGIGVAVSVSTSTSARMAFMASLWRTPKRCSSSMMSRPRFLNLVDALSSLWVPTTMSTVPSARPLSVAVTSLPERKRETSAIFTGHLAKRSTSVWKCCSASSVVGARKATCRPPVTAMKAARKRHLGLAEADVAADQPVHRPRRDHVLDHGMDGGVLVGGFLEAEIVGERLVVLRREAERVAFARGAAGIDVEQFGGGVAHLLARPCAWPFPTGPNPACAAAPRRPKRRCSG